MDIPKGRLPSLFSMDMQAGAYVWTILGSSRKAEDCSSFTEEIRKWPVRNLSM
jgi:hypothetical protein